VAQERNFVVEEIFSGRGAGKNKNRECSKSAQNLREDRRRRLFLFRLSRDY
jgi:hypothetical protein